MGLPSVRSEVDCTECSEPSAPAARRGILYLDITSELPLTNQSRRGIPGPEYRETGVAFRLCGHSRPRASDGRFFGGIVVIADAESGGQIPDADPEKAVSSHEHGIVALIRHAQDIDSFEGEFDWAGAQVLVRLPTGRFARGTPGSDYEIYCQSRTGRCSC